MRIFQLIVNISPAILASSGHFMLINIFFVNIMRIDSAHGLLNNFIHSVSKKWLIFIKYINIW